MMIYPESYAHLSDEEMEYVSGGLSLNINWWGLASTAAGLGTTMLVYLNIANIAAISAQLQQQDPDKYPETEGTINGNLLMDSVKAYFSTVPGVVMGLVNAAAGVGTVYLGIKAGN